MVVNLNVLCKVRLNDYGKQIWLAQINQLPEEVLQSQPEIADSIRNQIDENGCLELELWAIMNVFGPYISPVKSPFRVTTLELNKNPNFGNYFQEESSNEN